MKIAIDARFLGPSGKGIGRYLEKLIAHLEKIDSINQYFIILQKNNFELYQPTNKKFQKILINYPWYSWQEQILMPLKLKKYQLDLIHFPHFNVPIFLKNKFVITIHDLTLLDWPTKKNNWTKYFYWLKDRLFKIILRQALNQSEKIITDSVFTKNELIKKFNLPTNKIEVVNLGS